MAIPVHAVNVTAGQFVKLRGFKVKSWFRLQWWKVTAVEDGVIKMIDREGSTGRVRIEDARTRGWTFLAWEPGDPREDETE